MRRSPLRKKEDLRTGAHDPFTMPASNGHVKRTTVSRRDSTVVPVRTLAGVVRRPRLRSREDLPAEAGSIVDPAGVAAVGGGHPDAVPGSGRGARERTGRARRGTRARAHRRRAAPGTGAGPG